jgi:hypothetical protein
MPPLAELLGESQPEDPRAAAEQALTVTHRRGDRVHEACALRLLGEIASHGDRPDVDAADAHFQQALARATELEMRPLVAHCHLGLGTLASRTGDLEEACKDLTTAAAAYREMGMDFWLKKAEAALEGIG